MAHQTRTHQVEICRTQFNPAAKLSRRSCWDLLKTKFIAEDVCSGHDAQQSLVLNYPLHNSRGWALIEIILCFWSFYRNLCPPCLSLPLSSCEVVFPWRSACLDVVTLFHCVSWKSLLFPHQRGQDKSEVNAALTFRRGPGYLWEQQFGGGD